MEGDSKPLDYFASAIARQLSIAVAGGIRRLELPFLETAPPPAPHSFLHRVCWRVRSMSGISAVCVCRRIDSEIREAT